ncbi:MAG: PepSY-like domain-containing protein [Bacteroidetes bacterium]|nr:PepSY-like domain-containing protein [Bacteroidota bacterium]
MKKVLMSAMAITVITISACAQKLDASKVPAAVKASFAKQYPGATAKWEKEDGKFEAGFDHNGHEMSALFEANGTMTESEMGIKVSELPAAVMQYINTHHKGETIKEAAKITKANGEVNYEAEVKGKDLIFDASGKFLKEVKD